MRDRQTCIDCGKQSPETETNYTLISAQFGWRLSRRREKNGDFVVEWRCADCWREHKKKLDAEAAAQGTPAKPPGPEKRDSQRFAAVAAPRSSMNTRVAAAAPSKPPPRASNRPIAPGPETSSPSEPPRAVPPLPRPRRT